MDFLPLYTLVGKPVIISINPRLTKFLRRTVMNDKFVISLLHSVLVVALVQLAEHGQTSSAHPHLESLPVLNIGRGVLLGVVLGITFGPVGWRQDVLGVVLRSAIQILVAAPGNVAVVLHRVFLGCVGSGSIEPHGAAEGIIEKGVRDETAGVVGLFGMVASLERCALGILQVTVAERLAFELVGVERVDISSVVLIKVLEVIVKQDRGLHVLGEVEADAADVGLNIRGGFLFDTRGDGDLNSLLYGPLGIDGKALVLKGRVNCAGGHRLEATSIFKCTSCVDAFRIIETNFLNLEEAQG